MRTVAKCDTMELVIEHSSPGDRLIGIMKTLTPAETRDVILDSVADGVFTVRDEHLTGMHRTGEHTGGGNIGHTFDVDGTDEVSLTKALVWGRRSMKEYLRYYSQYLKGFENSDGLLEKLPSWTRWRPFSTTGMAFMAAAVRLTLRTGRLSATASRTNSWRSCRTAAGVAAGAGKAAAKLAGSACAAGAASGAGATLAGMSMAASSM